MLAEKLFQQQAQEKTSKWKFVRNAIPSIPGYSVLSTSADGLIGLKRNTGCKQRPAVVAGGKAERKLCFLRNAKREEQGMKHDIEPTCFEPRAPHRDILDNIRGAKCERDS